MQICTGRLLAAFLLAAALLGSSPASAQSPGQQPPCPMHSAPNIVAGSSYTVSTADRCQFVIFTNSGAITVSLPAPGLIFSPDFETKLLVLNGGTLTLQGMQDQAGVVHKINNASSLTLTAGSGAELRVLQDFNWWELTQGGSSVGTVTSTGLSMPAEFQVSGSPVINSGTLSVTKSSQSANLVYAGPTGGGAAQPGFRALGTADLPALTSAILSDFNISGPSDNDLVVYDSASGKWLHQRGKYIVSAFGGTAVLSNSQVLLLHRVSKAVTCPANFGSYLGHNSQAGGSANATASTAITVDKAPTATPNTFSNVGTITIGAGGVTPTFATSGGAAVSFAQGDVLRIQGPGSADATFAGFYSTLVCRET